MKKSKSSSPQTGQERPCAHWSGILVHFFYRNGSDTFAVDVQVVWSVFVLHWECQSPGQVKENCTFSPLVAATYKTSSAEASCWNVCVVVLSISPLVSREGSIKFDWLTDWLIEGDKKNEQQFSMDRYLIQPLTLTQERPGQWGIRALCDITEGWVKVRPSKGAEDGLSGGIKGQTWYTSNCSLTRGKFTSTFSVWISNIYNPVVLFWVPLLGYNNERHWCIVANRDQNSGLFLSWS